MAKKRTRRNPTRWGTSYFTSMSAAVRYYKDYGEDANDVKRKIREGTIHVGKPPLKPGERLITTDGGKRYMIEAANPRGVIMPARIRVANDGKSLKVLVTKQVAQQLKGLSKVVGKLGRTKNPSGKRYRGVITATPGTFLRGGVKKVASSWFETRQDATNWIHAMHQPNIQSSKVETGKGRIDVGKGGSWVR